ncbi:hypothetical protein Aph02nite_33430 [Actinoplanes philippinensis]|uniref:Uncharacterized protein n=1 Tax=Actinoplanes philippinensis TaxID=35752 RepID=A0A1I2DYT0_9ACTN|nr:hypothetical protein [Actinoplanes philippinensis]GIE77393.1 hypothetical protein Aph02nite_33430 [Actinoplanes philippinensis]SFE85539.1 hypothetical protein SAMN05421541_10460 [Actinoplanes philippinensis]
MPIQVRNGLVTIGAGLLLGFFGLIYVADLFGVAGEHARLISENRRGRRLTGERRSPAEVRDSPDFKRAFGIGRFVAGGGFMLAGLALVVAGIVMVVSPPAG